MAELTFKQKLFKTLYGIGLKNFGTELLSELRPGSPEWMEFVNGLKDSNDFATRKLMLQQLTRRGTLERNRNKQALMHLFLQYLTDGSNDEKRMLLKFVSANLGIFPTDDDAFKARILGLSRDKDMHLSNPASELLPKLGIDMDDPSLYRQR